MQNINFHLLDSKKQALPFGKCIERLSLKTTNHSHSRLMRLYLGFAVESVLILFQEMPGAGARLPFLKRKSCKVALTFLQPNRHRVQ